MFRINILALAGAVIASTVSIVAVSPALAADTATATVSFADLDLGSAHGSSVLDRRIAGAANRVCIATNQGVLDQISACARISIADAHSAVEQAQHNGVTTVALN
jgi:UrcA family protein